MDGSDAEGAISTGKPENGLGSGSGMVSRLATLRRDRRLSHQRKSADRAVTATPPRAAPTIGATGIRCEVDEGLDVRDGDIEIEPVDIDVVRDDDGNDTKVVEVDGNDDDDAGKGDTAKKDEMYCVPLAM